MKHVVMFSSGIGSWAAAKRVAEKYGKDDTILLFMDTKIEDEDNYRFLHEAAENVGAELVILADGRDPFEVYKDVKYMGNSRVDPCSRILKRELADKWIADNFTPETVRVHTGIDWTEQHRHERMAQRKLPWIYEAPLLEEPLLTKPQLLELAKAEGITPPRMYNYGFQHANCGGFCIKSGQAQFQKLYETWPERYREMEAKEEEVYEHIGSVNPFLRVTEGGELKYLTLKQFREKYLEGPMQCDLFDWGGCGCFVDQEE